MNNPSESSLKRRIVFSRPWIVVIASFSLTTTFGLLYSYGDFFLPLEKQFGWSNALDSTIPALALLVFSIGAIAGGYLSEKIGFRRTSFLGTALVGSGTILASQIQSYLELLVLFGIIMPLGMSFVVIIATAAPVRWFVKKRGLAVGVMAAGSGLGVLVVPPLVERLISLYDWRAGFFALGAGYLVLLCLASVFMQTPDDRGMNPHGWHQMTEEQRSGLVEYSLRQALTTRKFWMIYSMFFAGSFGATMFVVHAVPFANTVGISAEDAAVALGVFGAGSLIARIAAGFLADRFSRMSGVVIAFIVQVVSTAFLFEVSGSSLVLFYLCSFGIGFGFGGYLSDFVTLTGDIFGRKWIQNIWAINETAYGAAGLISPIVAGTLFDALHSYDLTIGVAFFVALVGLVLAVIFARIHRE